MFQQGGKFYLNASNWKLCQRLNYINNNKDRYQDIDNPIQKISEFPYNLNTLSRLKTGTKTNQKTGLIKTSSLYSVSSVRERLANEAGTNTGIDIHTLKEKMANTLSVMTNVLRNVVSKQRIRYKEKGFNLDLAYVCDNIIAMGYPADNYESMYRNPLADVYKFLEDNHHDHYKIYNLCLERSYDITKFHGRVSVYPFEDHNPPTIELILKFCEDVDSWLKADVLNVAAVHCKAGKGRTGTMICCYLLYSGQQLTAEDALACYDEKRTKDRKGVTIPSQRRYVQYFSKLMRLGLRYERRTLQFCEIRFSKATTLYSQGTVHCSICVLQDKVQQLQNFPIDFRKNSVLDIKNPSLSVSGDIKVELTKNTKKIFHFWFNTFFVTDSSVIEGEGNDVKFVYTLQKCEIDDVHKDKCYPDDFKVELVFYIDDNNVDTDQLNVSTGNRVSSNNRPTVQNDGMIQTSSQHQHQHQQQSNNYSLPPNNSSGSEINFICDQKSSSSTSVSSSFGVSGTDSSNGYESNKSTIQRTIGVVQNLCNHHSNHYMTATDVVNNSIVFTASPPAQHMTVPPTYFEHHQQHPQQLQQQYKMNIIQHKQNQIQRQESSGGLAMSTTIQRHFHRNIADGDDIVGGDGVDVHGKNFNNMETTCQSAANLNANLTSKNFSSSGSNNVTSVVSSKSYNHNLSNSSSKTNSVSSQSSSSAIGDNEEDWESGESQAKQLENITLLLSTSSLTKPTLNFLPPPTTTCTAPFPQSPTLPNTTSTSFPYILRYHKNLSNGISNFFNTSTFSSNSTSATASSSFNCPFKNTSKTSNSSCTNRVVGGDDDDDDDDDNNDDENNDDEKKTKLKTFNSKQAVKLDLNATVTNIKSVELKNEDNNIISSVACEAVQIPIVPASPANRPKLMHLLIAPKNTQQQQQQLQQQQQQSSHKRIFKRKFSNKLIKGLNSKNTTCAIIDCSKESVAPSVAIAVGSSGGVATTSKLKLKIKLKKNKFKLSQKFQWFQSYFRSDPVDFCENFVQQTTSMRHNSISSMASRTHKLSTTTPPSVTPPLPVVNIDSSCEQLDRSTSIYSVSTSNASIATGDLCEDYYSSICDNQLSFSNSPCKSPRSMVDIARGGSSGGAGGICVGQGSLGSNFARSTGVTNSYLLERRETLPSCSSQAAYARRNHGNVIIVAAKPAKTHAIGFNVKTKNLASQDSFETNADDEEAVESPPASIFYTPSSASVHEHTNSALVFPQEQHESDVATDSPIDHQDSNTNCNVSVVLAATSKPQAKYSLNLVIVKECPEPPFPELATKPLSTASNKESDGIYSDCCDTNHALKLQGDLNSANVSEDLDVEKAKATSASVCSNSSSSGFFTTTNSSGSSCNCNPFVLDLEKHVAAVRQQQEQNITQEVKELSKTDIDAQCLANETVVADSISNSKGPNPTNEQCDP